MVVVNAKNLTKIYNKNIIAVDNIDLEIYEGEVFGFLGPNGAGKSTTINMITGIIKATSGKLEVFGKEMSKSRREIQQQIGYIPQELVFYDHLTVYENLKLFSKMYSVRNFDNVIENTLDLIELSDLKDRLAKEMSGGQKRRLNLGIGMLNQPKLLLLDEPSAGMDPQSRNILWQTIERLSNEDLTIILTTHLMETADRLSDRVCIVDKGKVQDIDHPENLKSKYGTSELIQLQFKDEVTGETINRYFEQVKLQYDDRQVIRHNHSLSIQSPEGVNFLMEFMNFTEKKFDQNTISQVIMRKSTLEDAFIRITGKQLRE